MQTTWNRADLKSRGRAAFKKNYWAAVVVSLILAIVTGSAASGSAVKSGGSQYQYEVSGFQNHISDTVDRVWNSVSHSPLGVIAALLGVGLVLVVCVLAIAFKFVVGNVLEVGAKRFYIDNLYSTPGIGQVLSGFRSGYYWNVVTTMFCRDLFVVLWSLLLVIPGIVKSYEYYMVPYLMGEYPQMTRTEAFQRSRDMMYGQKWNAFVLDISFILWQILSGITFGIVGVFYVNPYVDATRAELYDVLAGNMQNGGSF